MSNQSSVQWLFQKLWDTPKDKFEWQSIFLMAHQMHKEEVELFGALCCVKTAQKNEWSLEKLYKETFGGQDNGE